MFRKICESKDLRENSMMVLAIEKNEILVGRRNGKLFACNNSCPHRGASLSKGEFNGNNIICYMHGYEFDIFTGTLVNMKSWKKDVAWTEQTAEWRSSGPLILYPIYEKNESVYLDVSN